MGQGLHYEKEVAELYEVLIRADCRGEADINCVNQQLLSILQSYLELSQEYRL